MTPGPPNHARKKSCGKIWRIEKPPYLYTINNEQKQKPHAMSLSSNFRATLDSFPYEVAAKGDIQERRAALQCNLIDATFAARAAASQRDRKAYDAAMAERQALQLLVSRCERVLSEKHGMSADEIAGYMHDA